MGKFYVYKLSGGNWKSIGGEQGNRSEVVKKAQKATGQKTERLKSGVHHSMANTCIALNIFNQLVGSYRGEIR